MNRIKLQSVCLLSILVLNQFIGVVNVNGGTVSEAKSPPSTMNSTSKKSSESATSLEKRPKEDEQYTQSTTHSSNEKIASTPQTTINDKYQNQSSTTEKLAVSTPDIQGNWGTSPWSFDEKTGILTIDSGTLDISTESPWKRSDEYKIDPSTIKEIDLVGNVNAPEDSTSLFASLPNLTKIDNLSNLNTTNVTKMVTMFYALSSLSSLDLSRFNTSQVVDMGGMFYDVSNLSSLDLSGFNTSQVTNMSNMFTNASSLSSLDLSGFDTSNVILMRSMFQNVSKLSSLKLSDHFKFVDNPSLGAPKVEKGTATGNWIREDGKSKSYSPSDFMAKYGTAALTAGTYVTERDDWGSCPWEFDDATGTLTIFEGNLGSSEESPWNDKKVDAGSIKKIILDGKIVAPSNSSYLFSSTSGYRLTSLKTLEGLDNLDTSQVTNMSYMFYGVSNLSSLDLSGFNTSQVTNMEFMFYGVSNLSSLDLSGFNTSQVTNMANMFYGASNLSSLDLSGFNTSQVTNMRAMFYGTSGLSSLDLSGFDTSNVTLMKAMFYGASNLSSLDLSGFDTSKLEGEAMSNMFEGTDSLSSLKLSDHFKFVDDPSLGAPKVEKGTATGNWIREDGKSKSYSPSDFMAKYGTADLTAGTYVGEITKQAVLELSLTTNKTKYTIGDKIETTLLIKHSEGSEDGSIAQKISLSDLTQFTLSGSQELPTKVTIETYNANDKLEDSKQETLTSQLSLSNLKKGDYYKILISGQAINNTDSDVKLNSEMKLSYSPDGIGDNVVKSIAQMIEIDSGELKFSDVPELMEFKSTSFGVDLNNKLIDRADPYWQLKISDLRGTVPRGEEKLIDRKNWNVYATADAFKDENGKEVSNKALAVTYIEGNQQTDLSNEEIRIVNHDVAGETPKDNSETIIDWENNEGIKAVVHDRSKLDSNKKYSSDMTFELRIEP